MLFNFIFVALCAILGLAPFVDAVTPACVLAVVGKAKDPADLTAICNDKTIQQQLVEKCKEQDQVKAGLDTFTSVCLGAGIKVPDSESSSPSSSSSPHKASKTGSEPESTTGESHGKPTETSTGKSPGKPIETATGTATGTSTANKTASNSGGIGGSSATGTGMGTAATSPGATSTSSPSAGADPYYGTVNIIQTVLLSLAVAMTLLIAW